MNETAKQNCKQLNDILRKFRVMHGFTQKQIAEYLHIDRSTYVKYETARMPEVDTLMLICELYHIGIGELLQDFRPLREGGVPTPLAVLRAPQAAGVLSDNEARLLEYYRRSIRKNSIVEFAARVMQDDEMQAADLLDPED